MSDEPSQERARAWPPRGIALSLLISIGGWMIFGIPSGGGGGQGPAAQEVAGWRLIPGDDADEARCGYENAWAALEYRGDSMGRVADEFSVRDGERWEFEDQWEAAHTLWALGGDPAPGSPQAEQSEFELAEYLWSAPADWRHDERTACVAVAGDRQSPPE